VSVFVASLGFGLVTASVLAIAAVGFTLQFGVTDVLNLAYGAVMIFGAFLAYLLNENGVSVWIGLLAAVAACTILSVLMNSVIYTPFQRRGASPITMVIVSLGMTLIIEFSVGALAGGIPVSYTMSNGPTFQAGRVITTTWALTGALCGLAGVIFAINSTSFQATSTDVFLVLILAAVFLGGPGQPYGAMLGALVIGLATEVSAVFIPADYKYVIAFVALLVMLGVRPTGLLGERT